MMHEKNMHHEKECCDTNDYADARMMRSDMTLNHDTPFLYNIDNGYNCTIR